MIEIKVKKLSATAKLPTRATGGSSGLDLYADLPLGELGVFWGSGVQVIPTGIAVDIPVGFEGQIRIRSGLAFSHSIMLVNGVGTIDSDYRGEIKVGLVAVGNGKTICHGDRIAQMIISTALAAKVVEVDRLDQTTRGEGGFGSTGQ
jgi:dUTP pyrophosphatase